jgi:hypothetical protein
MNLKTCLFFFIFLFTALLSFAQVNPEDLFPTPTPEPGATTEPSQTLEPGVTAVPAVTPEPVPVQTPIPYHENEFPQWVKDVRRAEVILIGTIPFTFFLANEIFDIYQYVNMDFDYTYTPWPFKSPEAPPYTEEEKMGIIITAVSISASLALIDYIIVRMTREKKKIPEIKK